MRLETTVTVGVAREFRSQSRLQRRCVEADYSPCRSIEVVDQLLDGWCFGQVVQSGRIRRALFCASHLGKSAASDHARKWSTVGFQGESRLT